MDIWGGVENNPISLHKYLYTESNPTNYIDPSGNVTIGSVLSATGTILSLSLSGYSVYSGVTRFNEGDYIGASTDVALGLFGVGSIVGSVKAIRFLVSPANLAIRTSYLSKVSGLAKTTENLIKTGRNHEQVARTVVRLRDAIKLEQRAAMVAQGGIGGRILVKLAEGRNYLTYGNTVGPTAETLLRTKGSWEKVIEGALRTNDSLTLFLQRWVGIL